LKDEDPDLSLEKYSARDAKPIQILTSLSSLSLFSDRRVIVISDFDTYKSDDYDQFLPYMKQPNESNVVIITATAIDARLKIFRAIKKQGTIIKFQTPYADQLPAWIMNRAHHMGLEIDFDAASLLTELVGQKLLVLASSLDMLDLYCGDQGRVKLSDVENLIAHTKVYSVFELTEAIGSQNVEEAIHILNRMLKRREAALMILAMIARHFRQLWITKELDAQRKSPKQIAAAIGIHPFFVNKVIKQARRTSEHRFVPTFNALYKTDKLLKSSRLSDQIIKAGLNFELLGRQGK